MYLGYDENGNIVTKDPSGERGESIRPLLGAGQMTQEEYLGSLKKMKQLKKKAVEQARQRQASAVRKAQSQIEQRNKAITAARKSAEYLRKMKYARSGRMYSGLGGVTGNGLIPHHVSGEEIVSTFKTNYGLGTSDFGSGQMGGVSSDIAKSLVSKVYNKMLAYESSMEKLRTQYRKLDKNSPQYKKLKDAYDNIVKLYTQTPVSYAGISFRSRQEAAFKFSAAVVTGIEVFDKKLASEIDQMFNNPVAYDKKVKAGQQKSLLAGYFGSEFDMGFGAIPLAAWVAVGAGLAASGVAAANAALTPDKKLDDIIASTDKLIAEASTPEQKTALIQQRATLVESKAKDVATKSVTGVVSSVTEGVGSIAKYATWGVVLFAVVKFGFPLLQSQMAKKSQSSLKPEPAQMALAGA